MPNIQNGRPKVSLREFSGGPGGLLQADETADFAPPPEEPATQAVSAPPPLYLTDTTLFFFEFG